MPLELGWDTFGQGFGPAAFARPLLNTMKTKITPLRFLAAALLAVSFSISSASAQPARPGFGPQGPLVVSPEVAGDCKVAFRILAPKAEAVRLNAGDIPGLGQGAEMTKGTNGVWEVALGPIRPGAYRYNFNVDGVS